MLYSCIVCIQKVTGKCIINVNPLNLTYLIDLQAPWSSLSCQLFGYDTDKQKLQQGK